MTTISETSQVERDRLALGRKRKAKAKKAINWLFTIILYVVIATVFVLPLLYVLGNSFRDSGTIWQNSFPFTLRTVLPIEGISFQNYAKTLGLDPLGQAMGYDISRNLLISLVSAVCVVSLSLIFNTGAAYFFARLRFPGKKYLLVFVLATMMIPAQVVMIPLFLVVNSIGIINSFWALVVPWYASPFIVFLLTQFMSELPYEYDEAAIMDGASKLQILLKVVLPNAIPGIITVSLMEFQFIWNEFYWPLIAITTRSLYPVQVAVASQFTEAEPNWGVVFAAMTLASAPIILMFLFLQRYFYESTAMSGLKG